MTVLSQRRAFLLTCIVTFALSIALFVILSTLYLVRRDVTFQIGVVEGNLTLADLQPLVPVPITVTVNAQNDNFFPITLENATVVGTHPLYNGTLGTGNLTEMTLRRRGNTTFSVLLSLVYDPAVDPQGAFILAAFDNCTTGEGVHAEADIQSSYRTWIQSGSVAETRVLTVRC